VRRGEIWRYRGLARQRLVLVISDDELNGRGEPVVVDLTETGPAGPMALLTVHLNGWGFARCRRITFVEAERFTERVAEAETEQMDQVDAALRVALSL
jgi:mRNA-degrading endonuclease toxin of MazEF toxin-antitoxin module